MAIKNIFKKKQWKADYEAGRDAFNAGQFKVAETHLGSALAKAVEIDEGDSSYGDTALLLGQTMRRLERYDEALELTAKAFRYYVGLYGPADPRTVQAHLSLILADPQQVHESASLRVATFTKSLEQFGPKSWQMVRSAALALGDLGSAEREKALGQAQEACVYVLGEGRQELGAWPPVAEEFALELSRLGYHDLAARFMGSQLRIHEERFGEKSEEAALTRLTLGEFFLRCGDWRRAETALGKALEQLKLKHGPKSELAKRATICLGQALARQGQLEQAAPYLTEALEKFRQDQGQDRLEALAWLLEYKCMIAASDAERGALWRELETIWESNPSELARGRIYRGFCAAQKRLQEAWELAAADRFLQAVLARVRQWRGPHHPDVAATMMDLAACAGLRDDDVKAMSLIEQSLSLDEGADNLVRSVAVYADLGERERALTSGKMALRLIRTYSAGLEQGRRQALFAQALLKAGDPDSALEQAEAALEQLPDNEQELVKLTMAEAHIINGQWAVGERLFQQALPRIAEPIVSARAHLQHAWLLCLMGRFPEMQESLSEVRKLASLRPDHPLLLGAKALGSQGAFYSGNVFQGQEERDAVLTFLRSGQHLQSRRALPILALLDPFAPDAFVAELEVGEQILLAARYPEASYTIFPFKDVACLGLRHVARALFFHGQPALADDRLCQFRERMEQTYGESNPLMSSLHLCSAILAINPGDKIPALESARRGFRELAARHVNLFGTLSQLAEQYIETGAIEKAKVTIAEALAIRRSPKLIEWLTRLESGQLPALHPSADGQDVNPETPTPALADSGDLNAALQALSEPSPGYIEPPHTEDETPVTLVPRDLLPAGFETADIDGSGTLAVYGGSPDINRIPIAVVLCERDEPPTEEESEALLAEVQARFGDDPRPRQEALQMLALLCPEGSQAALRLWLRALTKVPRDDLEAYSRLESRAREANAPALVIATLKRRLDDEVERYGDQATESIDTLHRLAKAFESRGMLEDAYQRVTLICEILRSWFGARSRRLLEPLAYLIRLSEMRDDVPAALDHHLERHRLLETGQSSPEELFSSRIALLPIRALLGQVSELMDEVSTSQSELTLLGPAAGSEFASVLLTTATRLERLHWRVAEAASLLEMALSIVPDSEASLQCRLQIAHSECQARRDYSSQAERLRQMAIEKATSLESEMRAEVLHEAAESCLRVRELVAAREIAERLLEERIVGGGRKDQWAGRALLVLAEADLLSFRLEGTETAIAMSRPSLEGSVYWTKAQSLKAQAVFFLGREEEAYEILDSLSPPVALEYQLRLAVWRGSTEDLCARLLSADPNLLGQRWRTLESLGLDDAIGVLDFCARGGRVRLLEEGLVRLEGRLDALLPTDVRTARVDLLRASLMLWERRWPEAEVLLQRVLDVLPADRVELPDGLSTLVVRGLLVGCLLAQDKVQQAEQHAKNGAVEAAEMLGEEDVRSIAFRSQSAFCAEARGEQEESLVILDEILVPLQERLGDSHAILRDIYRGLSKAFLEQDDLESAQLTAEEALRIDKECRGLSIHLLEDLHLLAKIERNEDRAEARNLLETARELATQLLPEGHLFCVRLEHDRDELDHEPEPNEVDVPPSEDVSKLAPGSDPDPAIQDDVDGDESLELEPSLDGWEVVEEEPEPSLAESTFDEVVHESAEVLFASAEELVEDSAFEIPVVDFERRQDEESEELELTDEEAAEMRALESEFAESPITEEEGSADQLFVEPTSVADELAVEDEVDVAVEDEVDVADELAVEDEVDVADELAVEDEVDVADELAVEDEVDVADELAVEDEVDVADELAVEDEVDVADELAATAVPVVATVRTKASTSRYHAGPQDTSASVEMSLDFQPVPFRVPLIEEVIGSMPQEPAASEPEPVAPAEDGEAASSDSEFASESQPAPSEETSLEDSEELQGSASFSISVEQMAELSDPEASLLPLAPVFFLPVPWADVMGAPVDDTFAELHAQFQEQVKSAGHWRPVVENAVSKARREPSSAAGYFLFLLGAQLEKGDHMHTADLCLATAVELLETGSAYGAACHLAGRVAGRRGELRRALDYFDRAAEVAEEPEFAVLKVDAAECHLGLGRPEEALIGFEEVFDYLHKNVPKVQALAVQAKMAQIHLLIGDPDSSQALAEDTLQRLSPKNAGTYRVLGRILLSRAFARLGRHDLALDLAEQAWQGARRWSAKRREGRRIAISNLVDIYSLLGRHQEAEEMIRESGLLGWGLAESELLLRAGHVACNLGKLDAARSYLRLGRSFLTRFRSPALWRSSFMELEAELALQNGDTVRADQMSRKALHLFEQEATGPVDRSRHLVRAARIAGATGDLKRARQLVEEAHQLRDLHLGGQHPHTESVEGLSAILGAVRSAT